MLLEFQIKLYLNSLRKKLQVDPRSEQNKEKKERFDRNISKNN